MRCPKDADLNKDAKKNNIYYDRCDKCNHNSNTNWICTRKEGHRGLHHAHQWSEKRCLEVWSD